MWNTEVHQKNDRRLHKRKIDHRHFFFLIMLPLNLYLTQFYQTSHAGLFPRHVSPPPSPLHTFFYFERGGWFARTASKTEGVLCPFVQGSPDCNCTEFAGRGITRYTEPDKWNFAQNQFPINTPPLPSFYYAGLYGEGWSMIGDISMDLALFYTRIIFYGVTLLSFVNFKIILEYKKVLSIF